MKKNATYCIRVYSILFLLMCGFGYCSYHDLCMHIVCVYEWTICEPQHKVTGVLLYSTERKCVLGEFERASRECVSYFSVVCVSVCMYVCVCQMIWKPRGDEGHHHWLAGVIFIPVQLVMVQGFRGAPRKTEGIRQTCCAVE